jgi:ATP-dependent DNA helicase RecG
MNQLNLIFPKHPALLSPDEIYEGVNQDILARLTEDRRLERKPAGMHGKELGEYFSMWANTVPDGGLLIIGMEDRGPFVGCHGLSDKQLNDLEKSHLYCSPLI